MERSEAAFCAVVGLCLAGLLLHDYVGGLVPPARLVFPLATAAVVIGIFLVLFVSGARSPASEDEGGEAVAARSSSSGILWLAAILPALYLGGFVAGPAAYVAVAMRWHGASLRLALMSAALIAAVLFGVFVKLMQTPLPVLPLWY